MTIPNSDSTPSKSAPAVETSAQEDLFNQGMNKDSGGEDDAKEASSGGEGGADQTIQNPTLKKPLYEGMGVVIDTPEQLVEYTKNLERQAVQATLAAGRKPNSNATLGANQKDQNTSNTTSESSGIDIEELLFRDPKKAVALIKEDAKADMRKELDAKEQAKRFWENFYQENPDLRNADRVVQSIKVEKWEEIRDLPLTEAKKVLATEARGLITQIRGDGGKKTELSKTSAATLPSSGGNTPAMAVAQDGPKSFIAEVRQMQASRKKA